MLTFARSYLLLLQHVIQSVGLMCELRSTTQQNKSRTE